MRGWDLGPCVIVGRMLRLQLFEMQIYCEFLRCNLGSLSRLVVRSNVLEARDASARTAS